MNLKAFHPVKLTLFLLASSADLYLTLTLVRDSSSVVYEANPIAGWWLEQGGALGLAGFKVAMLAMIVCLALVICRYRPRTGGWFLTFACSITTVVVLYSLALGELLSGRYDIAPYLGGPEISYSEYTESPSETDVFLTEQIDKLTDEDDTVRAQAACNLGQMGSDAAPAVLDLVSNIQRLPADRTVAEQKALIRIGSAAVAPLQDLLQSDTPEHRQKAEQLLARIQNEEPADIQEDSTE